MGPFPLARNRFLNGLYYRPEISAPKLGRFQFEIGFFFEGVPSLLVSRVFHGILFLLSFLVNVADSPIDNFLRTIQMHAVLELGLERLVFEAGTLLDECIVLHCQLSKLGAPLRRLDLSVLVLLLHPFQLFSDLVFYDRE